MEDRARTLAARVTVGTIGAASLAICVVWIAGGKAPRVIELTDRPSSVRPPSAPTPPPLQRPSTEVEPTAVRAPRAERTAAVAEDSGVDDETGCLVGRVVGAEGNGIAGFEVDAACGAALRSAGRTGRDGSFRLPHLAPGLWELEARHPVAQRIVGPEVEVVAGRTAETTLVYDGPAIARRIVVDTIVRPFRAHAPSLEQVVLHAADGPSWTAARHAERGHAFVFEDVAPGRYTLTIDDPELAPWRRDGVRPGRRIRAVLRGNAAIELTVVDAETGERLEEYELEVEDGDEAATLKTPAERPPRRGRFAGLRPGDLRLTVSSDGYASAGADVEALAADEVRPVLVTLTPAGKVAPAPPTTSVHGVVRDAEGAPVARGWVFASRPGGPGFGQLGHTVTDGAGRFSIAEIEETRIELQALDPDAAFATDVVALDLEEPGRVEDVELRFPPAGVVRGVVHAGPDVDVEGFVLVAMQPPPDEWNGEMIGNAWSSTTLDADGRFELTPLPYGELRLHLEMPPRGFGGSTIGPIESAPEVRHDLGVVQLFGPAVDVVRRVDEPIAGALDVVVRRSGDRAAGVDVRVECGFDVALGASGTTGANGRVRIGPLFPGPWTVRVASRSATDDEPQHSRRVDVAAGRTTRVELDL